MTGCCKNKLEKKKKKDEKFGLAAATRRRIARDRRANKNYTYILLREELTIFNQLESPRYMRYVLFRFFVLLL